MLGFVAGVAASTIFGLTMTRSYAQDDDAQVRLQTLVDACMQRGAARIIAVESGRFAAVNAWSEMSADAAPVNVCLKEARSKLR